MIVGVGFWLVCFLALALWVAYLAERVSHLTTLVELLLEDDDPPPDQDEVEEERDFNLKLIKGGRQICNIQQRSPW